MLTGLLLCGCGNKASEKGAPAKTVAKSTVPETISIYCYDDFSMKKAETLCQGLRQYFPDVRLATKRIPLPTQYYYKPRNRYQGTGLLNDLSHYRNGDAVLGLTNRVIFKSNEESGTYGIMGVSPVGTYKCVVSSVIPRNGKEQTDDIFLKLSLHELGHAFGLNHCKDQHCFMVDAEHKMKFPKTPSFCSQCKAELNAKGWKIK